MQRPANQPTLVVGAAIVRDSRVLATRRTRPPEAAGRWEFPGGKVEPGEDAEAALVREVREELGCDVRVTGALTGEQPIRDGVTLRVLLAELTAGDPTPHEHDALRWLGPDELDTVSWLAPDKPFLPEVRDLLRTRLGGMDQRLLLVHAHPDDETIGQGATMAKYVASGTQVTLVTCTLGEEGEILVPELAHLAADKQDGLGQHRIGEITNAMKELGVTDHRFLGGAGKYRDTGMEWHEEGHAIPGEELKDGTFWQADLLEASDHLVEIIREVRPQVLITYDQFGGYGHPDHIQAHRVAMYASTLAPAASYRPELGPPWDISKIYWGAMSESRMRAGLRALREAGDTSAFEGMDPDGPLPHFIVPDELLSTVIEGNEFVDAKMRAMKAYPTQIQLDGPFFAMSNNLGNEMWGTEFFRLAKGRQGPVNEEGLETDLFAGLG